MVGHGCPKPSRSPSRFTFRAIARRASAVALALCAALGSAARGDDVDLRLRIEWFGSTMRQWQGSIGVSDGVVADAQLLGSEADEPGSMWIEDGRLEVRQRSLRRYDGVDLRVSAPLDARLIVTLAPVDADTATDALEIPLSSLVDEDQNRPLYEQHDRLLVRRAPGDRLRVVLDQDALVFATGESFSFEVQPWELGVKPGVKARFLVRLLEGRSAKERWSTEDERTVDDEGRCGSLKFTIPLPENEGVYDVVIEASRRGVPSRINLNWKDLKHGLDKHVIDERKVQLVVLSPSPLLPEAESSPPIENTLEINPANPHWWERLGNIPLLPGQRKGPLGNGKAKVWRHSQLGDFVELAANANEDDPAWRAYPLPLRRPGEVHIIEVEYPSDEAQTLGLSVVEPNASGAVQSIGLDSGLYVSPELSGGEPRLALHRLVFWPRTKAPLLLVTNRSRGGRAVYGKIRVLGPHHRTAAKVAAFALDEPEGRSYLPRRFPQREPTPERLIAGYFDRPLFNQNFSASECVDAKSGQCLDDWQTFYEGATRLADYLNFAGYNGLMMSVMADGSAIYPTALVDSTPRYDGGIRFMTGQDPVRKDVVELLLRVFDREGLKFIPAWQFSTPLPALEELRRRGGPECVGLELVGADGRPWLAKNSPRNGLAPFYNPLNPRVQEAMLAVVREVIQRYRHHPSLAGVALQLAADGYAQLPGADWGYDDDTLTRFQKEMGQRLPAGAANFHERVALLTGPLKDKWLYWRARTLASVYQRLQAEVASVRPAAKLYLAGSALLDRPEIARELRPSLGRTTLGHGDALLAAGLDPRLYEELGGVVFLRPQRIAPLDTPAAQAVNLSFNHAPELDELFARQANTGSLFFHEPQPTRLESFDSQSPFRPTRAWLLTQPLPSGHENRRRFVHALATLDTRAVFDGGWLMPMGQETELVPLVAVFRGLPDKPFETLPGDTQPVVIRTLSEPNATYIYLANDSPWPATVNLGVHLPANCVLSKIDATRRLPSLVGRGLDRSWTVHLEPYDVIAARFSAEGTRFSDPRIELDDDVAGRLEEQIADTYARATVLRNPPSRDILPNPGFEEPPERGRRIAGWEAAPLAAGRPAKTPPAGARVELDGRNPHSGRAALRLISDGAGAAAVSDPFPPPKTGWLSISVWLRTAEDEPPPRLWVSVEGQRRGAPYVRTAPGRPADLFKLGPDWAEYSYQFPDLPAEALSPLRLRFELQGTGDVSIDDAQLFDLEKLDKRGLFALAELLKVADLKLTEHKFGECFDLLDGYWPRYLRANVEPELRMANNPRPAAPAPPPPTTPKSPGMLDRVKSWWR